MTRGVLERAILTALLLLGSSETWTQIAAVLAMVVGGVLEGYIGRRRRDGSVSALRRAIELPAHEAPQDAALLDALARARIQPGEVGCAHLDCERRALYDVPRSSLHDR